MEPMVTLTCYVQLREQFRSSMAPFTGPDCGSLSEQARNQTIGNEASSEQPAETPNSSVPRGTNPAELVDLENAFLAITEELDFGLPEPSPLDRIKARLMEATIGLLLFAGLLATACFLQHGLISKL